MPKNPTANKMKKFLAVTDPFAWFLRGMENGKRSIASQDNITQVRNTLLNPKNKLGRIAEPKKITPAIDSITTSGIKNLNSSALIEPRMTRPGSFKGEMKYIHAALKFSVYGICNTPPMKMKLVK